MPRDGSGIYTKPLPNVTPGTTIESTVYNTFVADVELDLNTPRPIIAGGTGANNATQARTNLKAEVAGQQVTNYDTHVFENGSFFSLVGATAAPEGGDGYSGVVHIHNTSFITLEARGVNSGNKYIRRKVSGTWQAWVLQAGDAAALDATYVNVTGDQMTGNLTISKTDPGFLLSKAASGQQNAIIGATGVKTKWMLRPGNDEAESTGDLGSNLDIVAFNDAGAFKSVPFKIRRSDSRVLIAADPIEGLGVATKQYVDTGVAASTATANTKVGKIGDTMTGNLVINKDFPTLILQGNGPTLGGQTAGGLWAWQISMGSGGGRDCAFNRFDDAGVVIDSPLTISRTTGLTTMNTANFNLRNPLAVRATGNVGYGAWCQASGAWGWWSAAAGNQMEFGTIDGNSSPITGYLTVSSSRLTYGTATTLKPGGGTWGDLSDLRIKNVAGPYTHGLDEIRQIMPVRYQFKGNASFADPASDDTVKAVHSHVLGKEFVGVIAQDIEVPMPETISLATAYIDGVQHTDVRILDPSAITYALVNAVKTLDARLTLLETSAQPTADARLDAGIAAALDIVVSIRNSMAATPDTFTAANFAAMKIQMDALTEVLAAMLQAQAPP